MGFLLWICSRSVSTRIIGDGSHSPTIKHCC